MDIQSGTHLLTPDKLLPSRLPRLVVPLERRPLVRLLNKRDDVLPCSGVDVNGRVNLLEGVAEVVDKEAQLLLGSSALVAGVADGAMVELQRRGVSAGLVRQGMTRAPSRRSP